MRALAMFVFDYHAIPGSGACPSSVRRAYTNCYQRKVFSRSDRVKGVNLRPTEPWVLTGLYNGQVHIYHTESGALLKTFEVSDVPIRCIKLTPRKNWFVAGSDDFQLRVFDYNARKNCRFRSSSWLYPLSFCPSDAESGSYWKRRYGYQSLGLG